jgi:death on curing protein
MRYLEIEEVIKIHDAIIRASGGLNGIRDLGSSESALVQSQMSMFGSELYPTIVEKSAVLGFTLISNHPFLDGNKRIGHAAMETYLVLNGYELVASVDEQEALILQVASGQIDLQTFTEAIKSMIKPIILNP